MIAVLFEEPWRSHQFEAEPAADNFRRPHEAFERRAAIFRIKQTINLHTVGLQPRRHLFTLLRHRAVRLRFGRSLTSGVEILGPLTS